MAQPGLVGVAPDLVEALAVADDAQRRDVALAVCVLAAQQTELMREPVVIDALQALRDGRVGDGAERDAVQRLVAQLDELAWDIQAQVETGRAADQDYLAAFSRARAAAALGFAFEPDPYIAAVETLYEVYHAVHDLDRLRIVVLSTMTENNPR